MKLKNKKQKALTLCNCLDISLLYVPLLSIPSSTRNTTPKHHYLVRHRVGLRGSAIEIDSKKGSAIQKCWEPLLYAIEAEILCIIYITSSVR